MIESYLILSNTWNVKDLIESKVIFTLYFHMHKTLSISKLEF